MVGGLLSVGLDRVRGGQLWRSGRDPAIPETRTGTFGATGSIDVQLDCGTLTVATAAGDGWQVEGRDAKGVGPTIDSDPDASDLSVRSHDQGGPFAFGDHVTWRVTLPQTPRLDARRPAERRERDDRPRGRDPGRLRSPDERRLVDRRSRARSRRSGRSTSSSTRARSACRSRACRRTGTIQANAGAVKLCAAAGHGPPPPYRREHHRELRLRRSRPRPGRLDLEHARIRHRGDPDRAGHARERRVVRPRPGRTGAGCDRR